MSFTECCTPLITLSPGSMSAYFASPLPLYVLHRTAPHRIAPHRNSLSATEPNPPVEPRRDELPRKPATLSQSHSSPELPVSPNESFTSSCSLRNARDDKRPPAVPCSLLNPIPSNVLERTVNNRYRCFGRKYERSYSEVTLLSRHVEIYGESKRTINVRWRTDHYTD